MPHGQGLWKCQQPVASQWRSSWRETYRGDSIALLSIHARLALWLQVSNPGGCIVRRSNRDCIEHHMPPYQMPCESRCFLKLVGDTWQLLGIRAARSVMRVCHAIKSVLDCWSFGIALAFSVACREVYRRVGWMENHNCSGGRNRSG